MAFKKKDKPPKTSAPVAEDHPSLHPGFVLEYWRLKAMFEGDPDIVIGEQVDDPEQPCVITVKNSDKAALLKDLLCLKWLKVDIQTAELPVGEEALAALLSTNPHFARLYDSQGQFPFQSVLMKPECVRVFSDDFFSPTGSTAMTAEGLAYELFTTEDGTRSINIKTDFVKPE